MTEMGISYDDTQPFSQHDAKRIFKDSKKHAGIALSTATQMRFSFDLGPEKWTDLSSSEAWDLLTAMTNKRKADGDADAGDADAEEAEPATVTTLIPPAKQQPAGKGAAAAAKAKTK
jgi:hypothetical protein